MNNLFSLENKGAMEEKGGKQMTENAKLGRVTIDEEGKVVGSGGNVNSFLYQVENQEGRVIGMCTEHDFLYAYQNQKPLNFTRKED